MSAFTLRLEPALSKKLDKICRDKGYSKTGLVKSLIRNFVAEEDKPQTFKMPSSEEQMKALEGLCGIVKWGGDALKDSEKIWED